MSRKAMIHMEGNIVEDGHFSMKIRTAGSLQDQLTMFARYIIQASGDFKISPEVLTVKLLVEVREQMTGVALLVDKKAIRDALDKANGQKE